MLRSLRPRRSSRTTNSSATALPLEFVPLRSRRRVGFHSEMPCPSLIALVTSCSTDSPRFHSHLVGSCRGRVHIGVLSIRLVLQSFCRPRRPGKKRAVTAHTVSFYKFLLGRSIS